MRRASVAVAGALLVLISLACGEPDAGSGSDEPSVDEPPLEERAETPADEPAVPKVGELVGSVRYEDGEPVAGALIALKPLEWQRRTRRALDLAC